MPKVPAEVTKESYLLKSTFFFNKLRSCGYFDMFVKIQALSKVEGDKLDWSKRAEWNIRESSWKILEKCHIDPMLMFIHPKVLQLNPTFLKYYRSVAMIPQKGLKALSSVSNVDRIEDGAVKAGKLPTKAIENLVCTINEVISLVISLTDEITANEIQGMMYATAGTNIDGSWRNAIGAEGERVIRTIILRELIAHDEVSSVSDRQSKTTAISDLDVAKVLEDIDSVRTINLVNGYSVLFSSEPDVTLYDASGAIVGVIEIKAGLDPAAALERLGAMLKSFENTLAEYPQAVTILVASCITDEVESRIGASMSVRQKYITTEITANDSNQRKFANRIRKILKLVK